MTVEIRCADTALDVDAPYHPLLLHALRSLPTRRWHPTRRVWEAPATRSDADAVLGALWKTGLFRSDDEQGPAGSAGAGPGQRSLDEWLSRYRDRATAVHYSPRTTRSYLGWIRRFFDFNGLPGPSAPAETQINAFLTHLAVHGNVVRARKPVRLPVVLTLREAKRLFDHLSGDIGLIASILYGGGLRLSECLLLRVQDLDLDRREVLIRDGKGAKDRVTMLPESVLPSLRSHLTAGRETHRHDIEDGWGQVQLPDALARSYPGAATDWRLQWVFPQRHRRRNPHTGEEGRHHDDLYARAQSRPVRSA